MTVHTITRAAFNEWYSKNAETLRTNDWIQFDVDSEVYDDAFDALTSNLTSCTELFSAMMGENGLHVTDDSVTFDPDGLGVIETVSSRVASDYEQSLDDGTSKTNDPESPWVVYGLSGDDDVDYNGSYIDTGIMLLRVLVGIPAFAEPNVNPV